MDIDPELTRSALQNLLDKAVKYTDVGAIALGVEVRPDEIVVQVRDNCGGISARACDRCSSHSTVVIPTSRAPGSA